MLSSEQTLPFYADLQGNPLQNGKVFYGTEGANPVTSPLTVYWDAEGTQPAAQPITIQNGRPSRNGAAGTVWVSENYSLLVRDSAGRQVIHAASIAPGSLASNVLFLQAGTGAVPQSGQDKAREFVTPLDFMTAAQRTDVTSGAIAMDHTAAVQAALNTGRTVDLLGYSYRVNNLTAALVSAGIVSSGRMGQLIKNANGPAITSSADYFEMQGVQVVGSSYTGDNIVATGNHPRFVLCSSYGTPGRALKATGAHVQIDGTCGSYTTTDVAGYDIEIGVSGTATLYHQIQGVYTSQSGGGILLIDTGSHTIRGGQIGKLTIQVGTGPAGTNGGMTGPLRIAGAVTVGVSNATFQGCQFNDNVTLTAGVTGVSIDSSNPFAVGKDIIDNSGNLNNTLTRNAYTGSVPVMARMRFGGSTSAAGLNWDPSTGVMKPDGTWQIRSGKQLQFLDASGNVVGACVYDGSYNGSWAAATGTAYGIIGGGSGGMYLSAGGTSVAQAYSAGFRPNTDNTLNLGSASQRWATVYAGTGAIDTSDARLKQQVRDLSVAERAVAVRVKGLLRAFKFNDAVAQKGDGARIHFGVIAQDVAAAFAAEGLDAHAYALFCYDEWEAADAVLHHTDAVEEVRDEEGNIVAPGEPAITTVVKEAVQAGSRYGIRYEELLAFVLAAL